MAALITTLIDKQDNNEKIRDQIAAILAIEVANQRVLAEADDKNPDEYSFSVYTERSIPWVAENIGNGIANVLFDNDRFDNKSTTQVKTVKAIGTFYIDCYAVKDATEENSGDELASKEADRIARLVRNILYASDYTYLYLGYDKFGAGSQDIIVTKRSILKREKFQPNINNESYENVIGCRLTMEVEYTENSPQNPGVEFELLINSCTRGDDGKILFNVEKDMKQEE